MDYNDNRYGSGQGRPVNELEPIIDYEDLSRYELTPEERAYEEMIRQRIRERRRAAERRRVKRNRTVALVLLLVIVLIICRGCYAGRRKKRDEQAGTKVQTSSKDDDSKKDKQDSAAPENNGDENLEGAHKIQQVDGLTFVDNILIVNKTYSLPSDYAPGINTAAQSAFDDMVAAAFNDGLYLYVNSGYRSYEEQEALYYNYAAERGVAEADRVSSRPGYSEHQSGLCFDVNSTDFSFADTTEAQWMAAHCAEYGFIIRFPKGKEALTGYEYEPWHIRFVGVDVAKDMTSKGLCLEEYLGVTSNYEDAADGISQQRMAEELGVTIDDPYGNTYDDDGGQDWDHNADQPEQDWYQDDYDYNGNDYGYDDTYNNGYYEDNYYGY